MSKLEKLKEKARSLEAKDPKGAIEAWQQILKGQEEEEADPNPDLKVAKLYASKGFMAEAKQNFVDYAERMHKIGKIQQAFAALKELADISPEGAHLRETLEEHLRMYGDPERRPAGTAAPGPPKAPTADDPSGKRKTSSLVFL